MIVTCPSCGVQLRIGDEHAGKALKCPKCQSQFQAPRAAEQPQPSADPLDQLASASSAPRSTASRRTVMRQPARKSKAPAIIGVVAVVLVIGVIGAVFSGSSSNPDGASWEDLVRAYDGKRGDWMVENFRKLRREDPRAFDREIEARRDAIKASGLSLQDYREKNVKFEERRAELDAQLQRDEAALKEQYEKKAADLDKQSEALNQEGYEIDRKYRSLDWNSPEYKKQMALKDECFAKAKAAREEALRLNKEMYDKIEGLRSKNERELDAFKDRLGWHPENW